MKYLERSPFNGGVCKKHAHTRRDNKQQRDPESEGGTGQGPRGRPTAPPAGQQTNIYSGTAWIREVDTHHETQTISNLTDACPRSARPCGRKSGTPPGTRLGTPGDRRRGAARWGAWRRGGPGPRCSCKTRTKKQQTDAYLLRWNKRNPEDTLRVTVSSATRGVRG